MSRSETWTMTKLCQRILYVLRCTAEVSGSPLRMCDLASAVGADEASVRLELLRLRAHGYVTIMAHDEAGSVFDFLVTAEGKGEAP